MDALATARLLACAPLPVALDDVAELGIIEVGRDVVAEHPNAPLFSDAFPIDDPNTNPSDFAGTVDDGQLLLLPNVNDDVEAFMVDVVLDKLFELVIFVTLVNGMTLALEPIDANPGVCSFFSVTLLKVPRFVRGDAKIVPPFILSVDTLELDELEVPAACETFVLELLF